jgi:hypothetical protein
VIGLQLWQDGSECSGGPVKEQGIIFLSAIFLSSQSDETGKWKKGK